MLEPLLSRELAVTSRGRPAYANTANAEASEVTPQTPSETATECLSIRPPMIAPANIASRDAQRLCHRGLLPPARDESAANPVIVCVRTVVVGSGMPSLRT